MQAVGRTNTARLGSARLCRSLDGSEKDNSCTGFVGSSARNEKLEICPGIAQGAQFVSQSAWAIGDFSGPHVHFFNRIRHACTSLNNFLTLRFLQKTKNRSLQRPDLAKVIGFFSFLLLWASLHPTMPHIAVMLTKDEGCCYVI